MKSRNSMYSYMLCLRQVLVEVSSNKMRPGLSRLKALITEDCHQDSLQLYSIPSITLTWVVFAKHVAHKEHHSPVSDFGCLAFALQKYSEHFHLADITPPIHITSSRHLRLPSHAHSYMPILLGRADLSLLCWIHDSKSIFSRSISCP